MTIPAPDYHPHQMEHPMHITVRDAFGDPDIVSATSSKLKTSDQSNIRLSSVTVGFGTYMQSEANVRRYSTTASIGSIDMDYQALPFLVDPSPNSVQSCFRTPVSWFVNSHLVDDYSQYPG
jgi:hypothetical protein